MKMDIVLSHWVSVSLKTQPEETNTNSKLTMPRLPSALVLIWAHPPKTPSLLLFQVPDSPDPTPGLVSLGHTYPSYSRFLVLLCRHADSVSVLLCLCIFLGLANFYWMIPCIPHYVKAEPNAYKKSTNDSSTVEERKTDSKVAHPESVSHWVVEPEFEPETSFFKICSPSTMPADPFNCWDSPDPKGLNCWVNPWHFKTYFQRIHPRWSSQKPCKSFLPAIYRWEHGDMRTFVHSFTHSTSFTECLKGGL